MSRQNKFYNGETVKFQPRGFRHSQAHNVIPADASRDLVLTSNSIVQKAQTSSLIPVKDKENKKNLTQRF